LGQAKRKSPSGGEEINNHSKKTFVDEIKKYDEKHKFESSKDK
jgi:hypothetical protein